MRHTYGPPDYIETARNRGLERTVDSLHWAWKFAKDTPFAKTWDTGGPFDSRKVVVVPDHGTIYRTQGSQVIESYSGDLIAHADVYNLLNQMNGIGSPQGLPYPYGADNAGASSNELITRGATAIARTLPTAPSVNVAQSLGEIREGLPSLTGRALRRHDAGGEYLNLQFGILPTVSDLKAYREASAKSDEILAQWRRDSGRRVRRRYTFAPETTVETKTFEGANLFGVGVTMPYAAENYTGSVTVTTTKTKRFWFSGAYRYYIPQNVSTFEQKLQDLTRQYGVPTPDALWELTPFSWLADWETNFGDILTNISNLGHDDLVLSYGYIMCHSTVTYEYTWTGRVYTGTTLSPLTVRNRVQMDVKQRSKASPYGLGWTVSALSERQWAILAALGLSRSLR